jgi:hypothetical protein
MGWISLSLFVYSVQIYKQCTVQCEIENTPPPPNEIKHEGQKEKIYITDVCQLKILLHAETSSILIYYERIQKNKKKIPVYVIE